jgi:hypothetical protein
LDSIFSNITFHDLFGIIFVTFSLNWESGSVCHVSCYILINLMKIFLF